MKLNRVGIAVLLAASVSSYSHGEQGLNIDYSQTTVSGLSSGGYMATQFHLAHGEWVNGVGVIAAGPYYCGQNAIMTALGSCVNKQSPAADLSELAKYVESQQQAGNLAPQSALKGDKAWVLHGTYDLRVIEPVTADLVKQYKSWLGDDAVSYVSDKPFSHHFPTVSEGIPCDTSSTPFIGSCDYDAAGEMLQFLGGELAEPIAAPAEHLHRFSQDEFAEDAGMGDDAFVYVPESCANGESCTLHISFHGCNQYAGADGVDDHYARLTGINRWAEANHMVVLYPQTTSSKFAPFNPQGCWDWWGYTNDDYATKQGPQVKAVAAMAKSLNGRTFP